MTAESFRPDPKATTSASWNEEERDKRPDNTDSSTGFARSVEGTRPHNPASLRPMKGYGAIQPIGRRRLDVSPDVRPPLTPSQQSQVSMRKRKRR